MGSRNMALWGMRRWSVLLRDAFTCQYCGQYAPNVVLSVDHKIALIDGGTEEEDNLVTACWSCNRGKESFRVRNSILPNGGRKLRGQNKVSFKERVMAILLKEGPSTATQISKQLGTNRPNIVHILRANATFDHKEGAAVYYRI